MREGNKKDIALIAREFEQNGFGTISSIVRESIVNLVDNYSITWIQEAMKIAVKNNKRKLSYVEGILQNWNRDGGMKFKGDGSGGTNKENDDEGLGQYADIGIKL